MVNISKLISQEGWTQVYEQNNPWHAYNNFLEVFHSYYQICLKISRNTTHLINKRKIVVAQELSILLRLNVNSIKYLSVIILTYIDKIMLFSEIYSLKSSDSLNGNTTLIFSIVVI